MKEENIVDVHIQDVATEEQQKDETDVEPVVAIVNQQQCVPIVESEEILTNEEDKKPKVYTHDWLSDYGPSRLWKKHSEMLESKMLPATVEQCSAESKNPMCWTTDEVFAYINRLPKCRNNANMFIEQEIDGPALLSLSQDDLTNLLKFRIGPAIKIYNQIVCLRDRASSNASEQIV